VELELSGRSALVSGASAGIGRGVAKALAAEGVRCALIARRERLLNDLANEIADMGAPRPLVVPIDLVGSESAPLQVRDQVLKVFGGLDILVNSAGGSRPIALDAPEEEWTGALSLSFTVVRRLTQAFLPAMQQQRWGRIINITGAHEPTHLNADQVAKAAQQAWAKGLSKEVGRYGITVNSVSPGRIMSEQIARMYPTREDRERFAAANIPLGYFGEPSDIGYMVAFLASARARYITGAILYVDGGFRRSTF